MNHQIRNIVTRFVGGCVAIAACGFAQGQTILIDTGPATLQGAPATTPSPDANGNTWNNFTPGSFIRLADTTGDFPGGTIPEGIGFGATTGVGSALLPDEGLLNPEPDLLGDIAVETATQDHIFNFDFGGTTLGLELSSVDPGLSLTFGFFASRAGVAGETQYAVTGANGTQTVTLDHENNTDTIATITGVEPNPDGTIQVVLTAASGDFMFLNAMRVEFEGAGGCNAADVAEPFGVLDLSDVSAFAAGFIAQDPISDIDDNEFWDLTDVNLFVTEFVAGCP
jgi:hypothetical protein